MFSVIACGAQNHDESSNVRAGIGRALGRRWSARRWATSLRRPRDRGSRAELADPADHAAAGVQPVCVADFRTTQTKLPRSTFEFIETGSADQ
jgi:hypothetical protein